MIDLFNMCWRPPQTDWIENFRMRKETFLYICDQLKPAIARQDTQFRRVAITIWCLATPSEYQTMKRNGDSHSV